MTPARHLAPLDGRDESRNDRGLLTRLTPLGKYSEAEPVLAPLCVDLDGTLVYSDTLVEGLFRVIRSHPAPIVLTWRSGLSRGRSQTLKREVAGRGAAGSGDAALQ